jgi:predicted DNA-binding protein (MmcQ/YjbR family)
MKPRSGKKRGAPRTRSRSPAGDVKAAVAELRDLALAYPGAHEEFPWGERVIKVKAKVFLFLGHDGDDELHLSVKLPGSNALALELPFTSPTGYGLGKSGWVSARFPRGTKVPVDILRQWIDESYRAVAPKRLVATLSEEPPSTAARKRGK